MSGEDGRLERIRAQAARLKHRGEHEHHETHEKDKHDGERAATADLPRIAEAIEKRMNRRFLGSEALGRHVARHGDGEYTWVMPHDFRSNADGLPYKRIAYNSHAFLDAYAKALMKELGPAFFVVASGHGPDAKIIVSWAPNSKPHDH